jgi:hypothetical protein
MGASYWSYFVPYQSDVSAAFRQLQEDVFGRRDFYASDDGTFESIEDLLEAQEAEGTHSILDMLRVSEKEAPPPRRPEESIEASYGTVYAMSGDELMSGFGSTRPTRAAIERNQWAAPLRCERGTGRYAFAYEGPEGPPAWIYFFGVSGD